MQKSKLQVKIQKCLIAAILIFIATPVFAAEVFLDSEIKEISIGQQFQVDLVLDTENEEINAVEGKLVFPPQLLEIKEIRDGNSIINFWVEKPRIEQLNTVIFSGITPGGYQDKKGFLLSVIFQAKASGNGAIEIRNNKVLLNDGNGTPANVKFSPFQFLISQKTLATPPTIETIKDAAPPEDFKPEIVNDSNIFDGKYFLVFATQDKGVGIDHYEISETKCKMDIKREADAKWIQAESPYLLADQELKSYIYVKAIDGAGNRRILVITPTKHWYEKWWIWVIILLGIASFVFWLRFKKHKKKWLRTLN